MMVLVPADWTAESIWDCAPLPSATIVMTAATPMIIPSIVRAVRILFRASAFRAIRKTINTDIVWILVLPVANTGLPVVASHQKPVTQTFLLLLAFCLFPSQLSCHCCLG